MSTHLHTETVIPDLLLFRIWVGYLFTTKHFSQKYAFYKSNEFFQQNISDLEQYKFMISLQEPSGTQSQVLSFLFS